jgi:lycopene cyclase domain-containing protein
MEYLVILLILFCVSLFLELKFHLRLYQSKKERMLIPIIFFLIGILWDSFAVARGHWVFNMDKLLGIKIGLLPIEEYLFFLIIPYTILTLYRVLKKEI